MDNIMDKNKASEKLRELLYKSNKTIKKNGIKYKFILDDDTILALKIAINNLENSETDKIEFESPKVNRLEMARVKNHFTLNESGYYIKIRKGTRVILDNATQEIYGITDSITLDILNGIVLEKE